LSHLRVTDPGFCRSWLGFDGINPTSPGAAKVAKWKTAGNLSCNKLRQRMAKKSLWMYSYIPAIVSSSTNFNSSYYMAEFQNNAKHLLMKYDEIHPGNGWKNGTL